MYVQEDSANNSSELVLDEFVECLVRIAFEKEPLKKLSDFKDGVPTEQHLRQGIADALSEWILASCKETGKKKNKARGRLKAAGAAAKMGASAKMMAK